MIRPGQEERLNLEGIDQFGNPTYIIVRLSDQRSGINLGAFSQAGDNQQINTTVSAPSPLAHCILQGYKQLMIMHTISQTSALASMRNKWICE